MIELEVAGFASRFGSSMMHHYSCKILLTSNSSRVRQSVDAEWLCWISHLFAHLWFLFVAVDASYHITAYKDPSNL